MPTTIEAELENIDISEPETIRLAQQGNAAAFEQLYHRYSVRVYCICLRIVKNDSEAEDLTQEVFLLLFRKIHTFRGESKFSTWLHRLTVNLVLMGFRKKRYPVVSLDETVELDEEDSKPLVELSEPDLRLSGIADQMTLRRAIDQLPDRIQGNVHSSRCRRIPRTPRDCQDSGMLDRKFQVPVVQGAPPAS